MAVTDALSPLALPELNNRLSTQDNSQCEASVKSKVLARDVVQPPVFVTTALKRK